MLIVPLRQFVVLHPDHPMLSSAQSELVLIGPMAVGKTSVAARLSEVLSVPHYELDRIKWKYILKNGYSPDEALRILLSKGFPSKQAYFDRYFGLRELEEIFAEFRGGILDLGASHSHFATRNGIEAARRLFTSFQHVVSLLPSSSFSINCAVLDARLTQRYNNRALPKRTIASYMKQNRIFLRCTSNKELATETIYTINKTVEEVANEIVASMQSASR